MTEGVTCFTVLSLFGFVGASGSHMSLLTTSGTHHSGGTLGFVVVSNYTTFMAHHRFTFGSYVTPSVTVCAKRTEALESVDSVS